ncbi:MAG: hypothetical protein ACRDTA_17295 [Pseudonocardiaceae bacterium]
MHLTGVELLDWIALRRVSEGGVALHGLEHLDHGRKMPCYLPDAFRRLAAAGLTEVGDPDFPGGPSRVVLTPHGRGRHQELSAQRALTSPEQPSGGCSILPDRPGIPVPAGQGLRWAAHHAERRSSR